MQNAYTDCDVADVPPPAWIQPDKPNRYGSVAGLDDEELADPQELERQWMHDQLGPVMLLPSRHRQAHLWPAVDEAGQVDWGAFGTVDFARTMPEFDKARYKADKLREQLKDLVIRYSMLDERVTVRAKYKVLKYVQKGWLDVDDIADWDMWMLAKLWLRSQRLRREIGELEQVSYRRRKEQAQRLWARYD